MLVYSGWRKHPICHLEENRYHRDMTVHEFTDKPKIDKAATREACFGTTLEHGSVLRRGTIVCDSDNWQVSPSASGRQSQG